MAHEFSPMPVQTPAFPATEAATPHDMIVVPGGTFRMGSDHHYPEEAPVHRVTVDSFFFDRTPVTHHAFRKFVNATGYVLSRSRSLAARLLENFPFLKCKTK